MKKSFTLAEVLLTLGIIGIIASLTIPVLIKNVQDSEFKNKMRKEYSVVSEAYQLLAQENGNNFLDVISGCLDFDSTCFKENYKTKLSYIKECAINNNVGICFPAKANVKWLNGDSVNSSAFLATNSAGIILKDGSSLLFYLDSAGCKSNLSPNYTNRCGYITLDVNGMKPPNAWGRDIYVFFVFSDAIRPSSIATVGSAVTSTDDCNFGANRGYTCASKYLLGN